MKKTFGPFKKIENLMFKNIFKWPLFLYFRPLIGHLMTRADSRMTSRRLALPTKTLRTGVTLMDSKRVI